MLRGRSRAWLLFVILAFGVVASGWLYYRSQKQELKHEIQSRLSALADGKAREIAEWRSDRVGDAGLLSRGLGASLARTLLLPNARDVERRALDDLKSVTGGHDFDRAFLVDRTGRLRLASHADRTQKSASGCALEAMRARQIRLCDLALDDSNRPVLDVVAPLEFKGDIAGALIVRIDPARQLYPGLASWPGPNRSGEGLIARREGDRVLFLSPLRFLPAPPLTLTRPLSDTALPAARAVLGDYVDEGVDYRGVAVLAAAKRVSGSNWFLVVKEDTAEIYAPIAARARTVAILVGMALLVTASTVGFFWRNSLALHYSQQLRFQKERQVLLQKYEYLTRQANDVILLLDEETGTILEASERAQTVYGYAPGELVGRHVRTLRPAECEPRFETDWNGVKEGQGRVFETSHRRKDGSVFPVEVSARIIELGDSRFRLGIMRDITERRKAEQALRESESRHRALFETMPVGVVYQDSDGRICGVNPAAGAILGQTPDEVAHAAAPDTQPGGTGVDGSDLTHDAHPAMIALRTGKPVTNAIMSVFNRTEGRRRWVIVNSVPQFHDGDSSAYQVFTTFADFTGRKQAEEELRASLEQKDVLLKELHHRVKNNLQVIIALLNMQARQLEDGATKLIFDETRSRVRSVALVHEVLYRSKDLSRVDSGEYIRELHRHLLAARDLGHGTVQEVFDIERIHLPVEMAVPCGLILNELIGNALKHGIAPAKSGRIEVSLKRCPDGFLLLSVANSIPAPADRASLSRTGLGLDLVRTLAVQLEGEVTISREPAFCASVKFPENGVKG